MHTAEFNAVLGRGRGRIHRFPGLGQLRVGTRLRVIEPVERFPHFVVDVGATGVISSLEDGDIVVILDEHLPGAEEWDNAIVFTPEGWSIIIDPATGLSLPPEEATSVGEQMQHHFQVI